jgi:putative sterol carrier protein
MTNASPAEIFAAINVVLHASLETAQRLEGAYQFELDGDGGGVFHIVGGEGRGSAGPGSISEPNATIRMSAADFVALSNGTLDGMLAFMEGRVRVHGDYTAALRLKDVLEGGSR